MSDNGVLERPLGRPRPRSASGEGETMAADAPAVQLDFRDKVQAVVGRPSLRAISRTPDRVKRMLLGGRSITIDGNTLDPTLQVALASSRLAGRQGLILSED